MLTNIRRPPRRGFIQSLAGRRLMGDPEARCGFELERKSGRVQPNVLDLRSRELIRHFDFFGVEHHNVFQFSSVDEPDVYALVAHS